MSSGAHIHHPIAQTRRSIAPAALLLLAALSAASQTPRAPQSSHALETYAALPIAFEANAGQSDHRVKFLAHARSYTLFLTGDEAVLSLPSHAIHLKFLGAAQPSLTGRDQLPGKTNYFLGNDPKQWHTNVPNYSAVEYHSLYPGIDALFHGDNHRLEFDFNLAPNANPHSIALEVEGAHHLRLNPSGDIVLSLNHAPSVILDKPHIYQPTPQGPREISGHYILTASNRIAFALGPYDHAQPLVIDPTITYATYLGGSGNDYAKGIAVDSSGNVYVAGVTTSTDFPTMAPYETAGPSFVTKLNSTGSALVYSTYLGGASAYAIAIDSSGSAYVTGTAQTGLPTVNPYQADSHAAIDNAFVTKLSPDGSSLVYSTYLGGDYFDEGFGIAVDSSGSAYVTGLTNSTGFPTVNPIQATCDNCAKSASLFDGDAFVTKLSTDGSSLVYSTYLGGSNQDYGGAIAVDSSGNAYITGITVSTDFPTMNPFQAAYASTLGATGASAFVTKLNAAGSAVVYSTYLGGADEDYGVGIAVDSAGSAYVTGSAQSRNFPTKNPYQATMVGANNAFVTKFNPAGSALVYSTYLGGDSATEGYSIALDAFDNVYVTGATTSNNFPLVDATQTNCVSCSGNSAAFVAQFNATGSTLLFSTYLGGGLTTAGYGIAVDSSGNAYVAGLTQSTNFPTVNPFQATDKNTSQTAFIAKFAFSPTTVLTIAPATLPSGTAGVAYAQTLTATGGTGTVTFDVTAGSPPSGVTLTSAGDLSGTPTQTGTSSFTVTATDSTNNTGSQAYSLQIGCPTITVGPTTLAPGTAGIPYGPVTFTETGGVGTTTFVLTTDTLPAGITFTAGVLGGETATQSGSFPFIVTATDSNGCMGTVSDTLVLNPGATLPANVNDNETITVTDTETFPDISDAESITVTDTESVHAYNAIAITPSPASFNASNGTAYQTYPYAPVQFTATGGIGTFTFTEAGALPSGITFINGTLTGTPVASTAGTSYTFSVTATDANGDLATLQGYTLTVSTSTEPPASVTDNETITVADAETFPDVADAETITITDTDTVRAYNAIAITPTPASFNASDGTAYATDPYTPVQFTATGGTGTINLTETGALPSGITFTNGALTGTPAASTAGNSYTFSVTATDADGDLATLQGYTLTVATRILPALLISANPPSLSIAQGQTGQTTLTFTPSGGYTGTLALGCLSLPDNSRCVFSQNGTPIDSLTPSGNNQPVTVLLTFVTDVSMLASLRQSSPSPSKTLQALILWWPACLLGLAAFGSSRKLRRLLTQRQLILCLLLLSGVMVAGLTGCYLELPHYLTPVGTSKVSVTATPSSGTAQTLTIDVTITK